MAYLPAFHHFSTSVNNPRSLIRLPGNIIRSYSKGWLRVHPLLNSHQHVTPALIMLDNICTKTMKRGFGTSKYGTPKTGLIVPEILNRKEDDGIGASFQHQPKPIIESSPLVSPLVNVSQSDLNDFNCVNVPTTAQYTHTTDGFDKHDVDINNDVALDIASMYDPQIHLPHKPDFNDPSSGYETATPLGDELIRYIGVSGRGGMSVAEYMGRCLRDERFGYYTNPPTADDLKDEDDGDIDLEISDDDSGKTLYQPTAQSQPKMDEENTKKGRAHHIIGAAGDFTTAPEISQIFGECLTVWLLDQYETLGKPSRVQLVEIGPGRGTLICDVLRSAAGIKGPGTDFVQALCTGTDDAAFEPSTGLIHGVHLVEVSEKLRTSQFEALDALELQMMRRKDPDSKKNESSALSFDLCKWKTKEEEQEELEALVKKVQKQMANKDTLDPTVFTEIMRNEKIKKLHVKEGEGDTDKQGSIPVQWYDTFNTVPSSPNVPTFIIGQEILDALPVHVFQKTDEGWKERLVDVAVREDILEDNNKSSISNTVQVPMRDGSIATTYSGSTSSDTTFAKTPNVSNKKPRFRYVLSSEATSPLRALLHVNNKGHPSSNSNNKDCKSPLDLTPVGTVLEVCPEAMILAQDIASRIDVCNGAALLIDYGNEGSGDTLRAFRKHDQVDVLSAPGTVDITADVDFAALKDAVNKGMRKSRYRKSDDRVDDNELTSSAGDDDNNEEHSPIIFGPVCQGKFLASMGAVDRTLNLIDDENTTDEQAEDLCNALERLVSEDEMGERYKVIAIARKKNGIFPPPGF